jgi:uncharacterized membrane protein YoaK (UPF0700 family)
MLFRNFRDDYRHFRRLDYGPTKAVVLAAYGSPWLLFALGAVIGAVVAAVL